ncbi:hypothetical protein [Methylobacterium sp. WL9]|uniref:hypothetical protein n=1 Tax=Methylobacterium sp. WL9 TaxID=2603898 RepID=UPI0011C77C78|nr:hypothetical protein [Methylobacterium sp. WL9]TXN22884.1 hypothetical protein FV217_09195 [Methylobacterium sp. WL9]
MKFVTTILDGSGQIHISATRAPDLHRWEISARTGRAMLIGVALAPPGLCPEALIEQADRRLSSARVAPGIYAAVPSAAVRAVTVAALVFRFRALLVSFTAWTRKSWRRVTGRLMFVARLKPRAV